MGPATCRRRCGAGRVTTAAAQAERQVRAEERGETAQKRRAPESGLGALGERWSVFDLGSAEIAPMREAKPWRRFWRPPVLRAHEPLRQPAPQVACPGLLSEKTRYGLCFVHIPFTPWSDEATSSVEND